MRFCLLILTGIILILGAKESLSQGVKTQGVQTMDSELKTAGMKKLPEHKDGVTRFVLENGMTVLLEENPSSPVAAVNVWVKVCMRY